MEGSHSRREQVSFHDLDRAWFKELDIQATPTVLATVGTRLVGSVVDIEPVHFVYNTLYLGMLAYTYVRLGLPREGARRYGSMVFGGLTFALVFQSWHEVEHVFKLAQYFALGVNGTGGVSASDRVGSFRRCACRCSTSPTTPSRSFPQLLRSSLSSDAPNRPAQTNRPRCAARDMECTSVMPRLGTWICSAARAGSSYRLLYDQATNAQLWLTSGGCTD